jgi:hypothetical protein
MTMRETLRLWRQFQASGTDTLVESTLNRVMSHIEAHDCAILSAFRNEYSKKENYERSRVLRAHLIQGHKYQITKVKGSYIEGFVSREQKAKILEMPPGDERTAFEEKVTNEQEVAEQSLFVVNANDDPDFTEVIKKLSEEFEQDSVMCIPMGGDNIYLYGTREDNTFPQYHNAEVVGSIVLNKEGEFMTRVGGRPFVVEGNQLMSQAVFTRNQLLSMDATIRNSRK